MLFDRIEMIEMSRVYRILMERLINKLLYVDNLSREAFLERRGAFYLRSVLPLSATSHLSNLFARRACSRDLLYTRLAINHVTFMHNRIDCSH